MIIPGSAIKYIRLQRTEYRKYNTEEAIEKYNEGMEKEVKDITSAIGSVAKIVDIGCGMAGVSVNLSMFYAYPDLYLIDKNIISKKLRYGFSEVDSFYNSFDVLRETLEMNGIKNYNFVEPENDFSKIKGVDLVISLLALGFHFPVKIYFERIYDCLGEGGALICDIRKRNYNEEIKLIQLYFKDLSEIKTDNPKTIRICAKGKRCLEK